MVELFVNKYPNAKVVVQHPKDMLPVIRIVFKEQRYIAGDQDGVFRSFSADVTFGNNDNRTGSARFDCRYLSMWFSPEEYRPIVVDNATDFILNEKCFAIPPR
jgi:hypothetical protein